MSMSHSFTSKNNCFGYQPDGKASQLLWDKIIMKNQESGSPNTPKRTPVSERSKNRKSPAQKNTLLSGGWLSKKENISKPSEVSLEEKYNPKEKKKDTNRLLSVKTTNNNAQPSEPSKSKQKPETFAQTSKSNKNKPDRSDDFSSAKKKLKFQRFDSGGSLSETDLPSFKLLKPKKPVGRPSKENNDGTKKYGVYIPTYKDIINERKDIETYKAQVENAKSLKEPDVAVSFSPLKNNRKFEQEWLDCKHLSNKRIRKYFKRNFEYLCDIKNGKRFSERHQRYQNKRNKIGIMTTKDLNYNTSMIVFTFEQIDHMLELLRNEFDPDDLLTDYFFKVLLPELCLKIFMDCHNMTEKEAVEYLDDRPVE